jgi:hypothetical protein
MVRKLHQGDVTVTKALVIDVSEIKWMSVKKIGR